MIRIKGATSLQRSQIQTDSPTRFINVITFKDDRGWFWFLEPDGYYEWLMAQNVGEVEVAPPSVEVRGPFSWSGEAMEDTKNAVLLPGERVWRIPCGEPLVIVDRTISADLTTEQAANILDFPSLSSIAFAGMLLEGKIPYREVGRHDYRVLTTDLMAYKLRRRQGTADSAAQSAVTAGSAE